jgi:DNA mismatch repair ATPase MutL
MYMTISSHSFALAISAQASERTKQLASIQALLRTFRIATPEVRYTFSCSKPALRWSEKAVLTPKGAVESVFGRELSQTLLDLEGDHPGGFKLSGLIPNPGALPKIITRKAAER